MGKLTRKGQKHCITNTHTGQQGRCFTSLAKARKELKGAICHARQKAGKVKSCARK